MASARHEFRRRLAGHPGARRASFLLAAALCVVAGCQPSVTSLPYPERIASQRATKDQFLGTDRTSPIVPDKRSEFLPLAYFPIDESYVAAASLAPSEMEPTMEMPTSTGERRQMRRAGALKFALKGQPLQLTAFVEASDTAFNRLFVPFNDLTNGTETYPAGRYLDLTRNASGIYEIDFNLAYQPYCYFNPTYDCPYPPAENRLKTPIRAGEKMKVTMR